jgi:glycerol uptake facilitator-like aquaporin
VTAPLPRRLLAEFLGTGLLVAVVVGSGIAAQTLSRDVGLELLENAVVTAAGLAVLILMLGPDQRRPSQPASLARRLGAGPARDVIAYIPAQVPGGISGAILGDAMFAKPLVHWSTRVRSSGHLWLGEVVATAGLILVIVALARTGKTGQTPWAVGAYIGAAYWFTSSTSFANPAVSIGGAFTDTFARIAPGSLPGFIVAQVIGAVVALGLIAALYPDAAKLADKLVVPHETSAADTVTLTKESA